jgi:hypothetical protein
LPKQINTLYSTFTAAKWLKLWGYIPIFSSMDKTSDMYEKIVKNGPYSEVAPKAQMNIGAAREKQSNFAMAAKAYETAADRYHDRPQVAADALYRQALAYNKQAQTAEYDQSTAGQAISTGGQRIMFDYYTLDGVNNTDPNFNTYVVLPSIDAIQEFKVQSGNYSAEYGGNAGANINVQLRSGTNQFHGAAFEFLRNNALDARGYFRPQPLPKDILHRNQFGAVLAGPVRRHRDGARQVPRCQRVWREHGHGSRPALM